MSFNKFKTTVRKLADLSWPDLRDLFTWPSGGSTIQADNPNLLIAKAANERGETIAFVTAEPILLVDGYVFNPQSNREDDQKAGDAIDCALAQRAGVNRIWIAVPNNCPPIEGEYILRVVERKVYQPVTATQRLGCCDSQSPTAFIN